MTTAFEFALNEVNVWKYLNHKNVCKLFQIIDDEEDEKDQLYLIMQLGDLGCLMDYNESE
jgi:[calcium/calmodulin-dependent protein kinase] kinase